MTVYINSVLNVVTNFENLYGIISKSNVRIATLNYGCNATLKLV